MRLISSHDGKLLTLNPGGSVPVEKSFSSGLAEWDAIAPGGAFARGAVHELLTEPANGKAMFAAMLLAGGAGKVQSAECERGSAECRVQSAELNAGTAGNFRSSTLHSALCTLHLSASAFSTSIIWIDPARELYPPALAAHGFPLNRLFLLQPKIPDPRGKDLIWAIAECLRCKGVCAVVAAPPRLSRIQARRLQLAAEQGGGVGLLLRHVGRDSAIHAAATRWLIRPAPGGRNFQRWTIQLLHGHGGRVGQTLCLEHCRETNHLHTFKPVADRSPEQKQAAG